MVTAGLAEVIPVEVEVSAAAILSRSTWPFEVIPLLLGRSECAPFRRDVMSPLAEL